MSYTLHDQPDLYTPVYNPMRFVVESSNRDEDNFQYVVDVYTSGVSGYTRLLYPPEPAAGKAAPDIQGVMESQITFNLSDTTYGFQRCNDSIKTYEVKFGEQYGPSSGIVTYPNIVVTGTKYAWNGVFDPPVFRTFAYNGYTMGGSGVMLTNQPSTLYFTNTSTDHKWLYFINDTSGTAYFAKIKTYDVNDALLGTYQIENADQASSSYLMKMLTIDVGSNGLNNATLYTGAQPVITASVEKYTVEFTNFAGTTTSTVYTYQKECQWKGLDPVSLVFLNRKGGFDAFNFRLVRRLKSRFQRERMQRNLGAISGNSWTYATVDRGTVTYNTEITDSIVVESDWINGSTSTWLQELVESPEVYRHDGSQLIPVDVTVNEYEIKSIVNEKLFNLSLTVDYANKRWTQRG